jgi:hypothetical protein
VLGTPATLARDPVARHLDQQLAHRLRGDREQ